MKEKWIYSKSEDLYWEYSEEFKSKEEAIECAKEDEELEGNGFVFVGKKVSPTISEIDVDSILENIAENTTFGLDDGLGDEFLMNVENEHFDELEERLNNVFIEWMYKYNYNPNWFEVVGIEEIKIH